MGSGSALATAIEEGIPGVSSGDSVAIDSAATMAELRAENSRLQAELTSAKMIASSPGRERTDLSGLRNETLRSSVRSSSLRLKARQVKDANTDEQLSPTTPRQRKKDMLP